MQIPARVRSRGKQRIVRQLRAADGSIGTLRLGPSTAGTTCWKISFRDGHGGGGCEQKRYRGPALSLSVDSAGVVQGSVSPRVKTVELTLRTGRRVTVEPLEGVVLVALTREEIDAGGIDIAVARDGQGQEIGRQRFGEHDP